MEFLGTIYDLLFGWLYSTDMADYLSGVTETADGQEGIFQFPGLWLVAILVPLVVALLFYKLVDSPKTNRWWIWLIVGIIDSFLVWGYTLYDFFSQYRAGEMPVDENGDMLISNTDLFGVANAQFVLAFFFFFMWSLVFKFASTNNRYTPFKFLQK